MRQIVLDTETTGLETSQGHRIIEIGCVELKNRQLTGRHYHQYIKPEREIDQGAIEIHGITNEFLADKPVFNQIAADFLDFVRDAELIIHNAPFDVGFIDYEFELLADTDLQQIGDYCSVIDTLVLARKKHPGQKNNLDALCKRYHIDNSDRSLHGALLDARLLAGVYLAMTGGQGQLFDDANKGGANHTQAAMQAPDTPRKRYDIPVVLADETAIKAHAAYLDTIEKKAGEGCVWLELEDTTGHKE